MIKHIKKFICFGFLLVLCLGCLTGCKDIEEEVDADFAKYTVDENLALDDGGAFKFVSFSTHILNLNELEPDKQSSYKDRGFVIYQKQVYFTRAVKHDDNSYPCIYKCDLYGNGIELVVELTDANYVGSNGYEKIMYLEFNSTKDSKNAVIKSYNIETGEYKYVTKGLFVDPYVNEASKIQRQYALQRLGIEIATNHKKNFLSIKKDDESIIIDKEKLQEYDFGQSIVKYNGKVLFNQVLNGSVYLGYKIVVTDVKCALIILEYDISDRHLAYKGYFKTIISEHFYDRIDCLRQIY